MIRTITPRGSVRSTVKRKRSPGIAGPGGGTDDKPVGTVYLGLCGPDGTRTTRRRFPGDRQRVRQLSSQWSLDMLRAEVAG